MQASSTLPISGARVQTLGDRWPSFAVLLFGLMVLYATGFSDFPRVHNAAHDTRHANGFPCH